MARIFKKYIELKRKKKTKKNQYNICKLLKFYKKRQKNIKKFMSSKKNNIKNKFKRGCNRIEII